MVEAVEQVKSSRSDLEAERGKEVDGGHVQRRPAEGSLLATCGAAETPLHQSIGLDSIKLQNRRPPLPRFKLTVQKWHEHKLILIRVPVKSDRKWPKTSSIVFPSQSKHLQMSSSEKTR